jgi:proteasome accessory factor B
MSAQKTERLINLTLALLATKRHLTKSEIFKAIAGYSGSPETMERMFERDKDELRSLGIEIEVKGIDPLFEDEQGYLIRSETFQLRDNEFSKEELLYLTMAANLWRGTALGSDSKAALLKIQSLSGPIESDAINTPALRDSESAALLSSAFEAVDAEQLIKFGYKGKVRTAQPFGLYTKDGFWYLVAREENEVKSFKLLRIEGKIVKEGKAGSFKKPPEFDLIKFLSNSSSMQEILAQVLVRKEQAHVLRSKYSTKEIDDEWDLMLIPYIYEQEIIETILWYGTNVIVNSPASLRSEVISRLKVIANG